MTVVVDTAATHCNTLHVESEPAFNPNDTAERNCYGTGPVSGPWIGASDAAVEGQWRWEDGTLSGSAAGREPRRTTCTKNWAMQDPRDSNALQDCAVVDIAVGTTGGWVAIDCSLTNIFVCESL